MPPGWETLERLGFTAGDNLNALNPFSFTGGAYLNAATGEIVIAYKGTDFLLEFAGRAWNTAGDLAADLGLAFDRLLPLGIGQQLSASAYYFAVKDWAVQHGHDPARISFTGHSLGGGLAATMAVWYDRPATTFAAAPFERSATSAVAIGAAITAATVQSAGSASIAVLEEVNRLRELLVGELLAQGEVERREAAITNLYNEGEFLQYARVFLPTLVGTDTGIDLGDSAQPLEYALGLHGMNLHAAFLFDDRLRQRVKDIPELLPALLDTRLYATDPNTATPDFITRLVNDHIRQGLGQGPGQPSALTRFTDDLTLLRGTEGLTARPDVRQALIALAMDFHHHAPADNTSGLFRLESGALHVNLDDINSPTLKGLPLLRDALSTTAIGSDPFEVGGFQDASHWHNLDVFEARGLMVAFGLMFLVQNAISWIWGGDLRGYDFLTQPFAIPLPGGQAQFAVNKLLVFGLALLFAGALIVLLRTTLLGKGVRALMQSPTGAQLVGIDTRRLHPLMFGIGLGLSGVAGCLLSMAYTISPSMGEPYTVTALIVITLGGFGSMGGALAGGLLLGVIEAIGMHFTNPSLKALLSYIVFIGVLLLRPEGLFTRKTRKA